MKYFFTVLALLSTSIASAQILSAQSGAWDISTTWVGGQVPSVTDEVVILNGHTITGPSVLYTAECRTLEIEVNGRLEFQQNTISVLDTLLAHGHFISSELLFGDSWGASLVPGYILAEDSFVIDLTNSAVNYMGDLSIYTPQGVTMATGGSSPKLLGDIFLDGGDFIITKNSSNYYYVEARGIFLFPPFNPAPPRKFALRDDLDFTFSYLIGGNTMDSFLASNTSSVTFLPEDSVCIEKDSLYLNLEGVVNLASTNSYYSIEAYSDAEFTFNFDSLNLLNDDVAFICSNQRINVRSLVCENFMRMDIGDNDLYIDTNGNYEISYFFFIFPWASVYSTGNGKLWYYLAPDVDPMQTGTTNQYYTIPIGTDNPNTVALIEIYNDGVGDWFSLRMDSGVRDAGIMGNYYLDSVANWTIHIDEKTAGGSDIHLKFNLSANDTLNNFTSSQAGIMHYTNGAWNNDSTGPAGYNSVMDMLVYERANISSFSPFAVGSISSYSNINLSNEGIRLYLSGNSLVWSADIAYDDYEIWQSDNSVEWELASSTTMLNTYKIEDLKKSAYFRVKGLVNERETWSNIVWFSPQDNFAVVKIYPNPVHDIIYIEAGSEFKTYSIRNTLGQNIRQGIASERIDVRDIHQGMYILSLYTPAGESLDFSFHKTDNW